MKKFAKVALVMVAAVALVVCSILGTLAYLQATSEVAENTFTVGNVAITLDEAKVDVYGDPVEGAARVTANEYKLIPGHEYTKDPTVTVKANSEEAYVRMIVTITDLEDVKAVFGTDAATGYFLPQYFVEGWDANVWLTKGVVENGDNTATYEFWYNGTVDTLNGEDLTLDALFDAIVVPDGIESTALETVKEMKIDVVANAIQADGFATAELAWAAFDAE